MPHRALITGGNRGIGLAIAKGLVAKGLDVTIAGRDLVAIAEAAGRIGVKGAQLDVSSDAQCREVVDKAGGFFRNRESIGW